MKKYFVYRTANREWSLKELDTPYKISDDETEDLNLEYFRLYRYRFKKFEQEVLSDFSNEIRVFPMPEPEEVRNLMIVRTGTELDILWDYPEVDLPVGRVVFVIYKDGVEVGRTTNRYFNIRVDMDKDYEFNVVAMYEVDPQ